MNDHIVVFIADDEHHERCFAEMYVDNALVGIVSEETPGKFVLELPGAEFADNTVSRYIALDDFQNAVRIALCRLRGGD